MRALYTLGLVIVIGMLPIASARAHSGGRPGPGCVGCHGGGDVSLSLTTSPSIALPGDEVTVTIAVDGNGFGTVAGVFIDADDGTLATISGQGLAAVAAGLTHSQPKNMAGNTTEFAFRWTAPNAPGAVRFAVSVLVGNDNNSSSGDRGDDAVFDLVFGCEGQAFFLDFDDDGYGRDDASRLECSGAAPSDHAAASGDCDDTRATVHPTAVELCNQRDDDCDSETDEDAIPIPLYPDGDADGYYGQVEATSPDVMMGCVGTPDYAGEPGDCEPNDPTKHPGAEEICNLYDDNCDGRADERVRPICGIGWCAREAWTCEPENCDPGEPQPETCNLLDDDCDDELDEDAECPDGAMCIAGECREADAGDTSGGVTTGMSSSTETGTSSGAGPEAAGSSSSGCAIDRRAAVGPLFIIVLFVAPRRRGAVTAPRS